MNKQQQRFVEDMGQLMVAWGVSRTTGRIYGYLLLRAEPVSLDELAKALSVAKSGASVATRQLQSFGLALAGGETGSRRVRYTAHYDLDAIIAARTQQTLALIAHLEVGAHVATVPLAKRRLGAMSKSLARAFERVPTLTTRAKRRTR